MFTFMTSFACFESCHWSCLVCVHNFFLKLPAVLIEFLHMHFSTYVLTGQNKILKNVILESGNQDNVAAGKHIICVTDHSVMFGVSPIQVVLPVIRCVWFLAA